MEIFKNEYYKITWRALLCVWLAHGIIALWQFLEVTPLDDGLSPVESPYKYLFVCLLLVFWISLNVYLVIISFREASAWRFWLSAFEKVETRDFVLFISCFLLLTLFFVWYMAYFSAAFFLVRFFGYVKILEPIFDLIFYIALEITVFIAYINMHSFFKNKNIIGYLAPFLLGVFGILSLLVFIIYFSGLGILPNYKGDWDRGLPAVPLLEWQILLAYLFGSALIYFELKSKNHDDRLVNLLFFWLIWFGVSVFWISQPVVPHLSALPPNEPNFEIYPFIDALTYDREAMSILAGNGFVDTVPQRPLYIIFLAIVHLIVGQDYHQMIAAQSLVFALFPALLFLLGSELFDRPLGVSLALLAALRDYTSNLVAPFTGNLSYSKVFLSEIPTAIFLVCILLIGIRWIRSNYSVYFGFLLGGFLGIAMLIRTQVIVVLPVLILCGYFILPKHNKILLKNILFIFISASLVVSPWLWRNWKLTGDLIFDNPASQTGNLALRYSRLNGVELDAPPFPGETSSEFADRLLNIAKDAIVTNPAGAIWAISNSFLNHGIDNILIFPLRNEIRSPGELWIPSDAFWEKWEGRPTHFQSILLAMYIIIFGFGVSFAWYRRGWLGLLPLGFNLAYNLWTSIALLSGQRFMLAMDWSIYLYYMLGLFSIASACLLAFNRTQKIAAAWIEKTMIFPKIYVPEIKQKNFLVMGALFLGVGLSLPVVEKAFPVGYPDLSREEVFSDLFYSADLADSSQENIQCLKKTLSISELQLLQGKALYPIYYAANDGEQTDSFGYKPVNQDRLVFEFIGQKDSRIIFPISKSPDFFPHYSDVTLIYGENKKDLLFIWVRQGQIQRLYVSDEFNEILCA